MCKLKGDLMLCHLIPWQKPCPRICIRYMLSVIISLFSKRIIHIFDLNSEYETVCWEQSYLKSHPIMPVSSLTSFHSGTLPALWTQPDSLGHHRRPSLFRPIHFASLVIRHTHSYEAHHWQAPRFAMLFWPLWLRQGLSPAYSTLFSILQA